MSPRSVSIADDPCCVAIFAAVAFVLSGSSIVVVNKTIVHDNGLHTPALVSSTGVLFTAVFTRALVWSGHVQVKRVAVRPAEFAFCKALPMGMAAAGSLYFGNMALIYLDAGFAQMFRAGMPALLLFVLWIFRERVTPSAVGFSLMMVFGSTLAALQQPNATPIGVIVQFTSMLCEALYCTGMQKFLQGLGFDTWDAGYYLYPANAMCCLLTSLLLEWPHVIAAHQVGLLHRQVPLLCLSGALGIMVNFSGMYLTQTTSSLYAKLLSIARSAALVLIFIANGEDFTMAQVVGYGICLSAFVGYTVLKQREIQQQQELQRRLQAEDSSPDPEPHGSDDYDSDEDPASPTDALLRLDLTKTMFWFAVCVVVAGAYQATIIGDLPACAPIFRELTAARRSAIASGGVPPTPYLAPMAVGVQAWAMDDEEGGGAAAIARGGRGGAALGASVSTRSVESSAKVLFLDDGRFLLHSRATGGLELARRAPETVLSSSWVVTSEQFGQVYLSSLDNQGGVTWLSCDLALSPYASEACLLWMTAAHWDRWTSELDVAGEYLFRRQGEPGLFLGAEGSRVVWSREATPFRVGDWVPEVCPLRGMTPSPRRYEDAEGEVTFTMTTFFHVYARSIMFRQALSSVFTHLKERDTYVREFLVVNDWYDGRSLAFNGTFTAPDLAQTRRDMLAFFPGCVGAGTQEAAQRPLGQRCTFVFKGPEERGQPKALNILLDLMRTKFWVHFEDDHVFYRDVYVSRLLAPMYDYPDSCWRRARDGEDKGCIRIAGVRLAGVRGLDGAEADDGFDLHDYHAPELLRDHEYVRELLAHGGFDDDHAHGWGRYEGVKAVPWPLFSLRPALHNLTYIKSLEAPLFHSGRPGRFSEDSRITDWSDSGHNYTFKWDFELEFAVRWARGGATLATLSPGVCMRDVSNGISSFERGRESR